IVSDALDMAGASGEIGIPAAAVRSLAAGTDLLCIGTRNTDEQVGAIEDAIVEAVRAGDLAEERLAEAARRVRGMTVPPAASEATGALVPGRIAAVFDVRPEARPLLGTGGDWIVVRLEAEPNMAVGASAWGPFAAAEADQGSAAARRFAGWRVVTVAEDDRAWNQGEPGRVLVVGRDIHRHSGARAVVDGLRAGGGDVLVVDMGWPSPDRRYADIATFGASRAVGEALLELVAGTR
ncbi:MAG: glycoside hydrolase family 3 N-terminal domain-containing protein, partial [Amnibacterium sp.]